MKSGALRATNGLLGLSRYPKADVLAAARELGLVQDVELPGSTPVTLSAKLGDLYGLAKDFRTDFNPFRELARICERLAAERKRPPAAL